jgi:hypothetical protein
MPETVYHETVPYDLSLRVVLGNAVSALGRQVSGAELSEGDAEALLAGAAMLSPTQPEVDRSSYYTQARREYRLLERAREALDVPDSEEEKNVRLLLGRASFTLEGIASGEVEPESDVTFTNTVLESVRQVAASRRARSLA